MKRFILLFFTCFHLMPVLPQFSEANLQYTHPKKNSILVNPNTSIIFSFNRTLNNDEIKNLCISINSDTNQTFPYELITSEQNKTLIIKPVTSLAPGKNYMVTLKCNKAFGHTEILRFTTSEGAKDPGIVSNLSEVTETYPKALKNNLAERSEESPRIINDVAVPSDFPVFKPSIPGETAPGYLYLTNYSGPSYYIMIIANDGTPLFYRKMNASTIDWKIHENGMLSCFMYNDPYMHLIMDESYNITDTIYNVNGYQNDPHEFLLLKNGHALLIAGETLEIDMSTLVPSGYSKALVTGNHLLELDENKNVVFEFNCWNNFDITGALHENLKAKSIDYVHMNSIAVDYDSNLVISSRNLNECTKIHRKTGEIIWRLGGKYNQLTFVDEEIMLEYQHDFRPVPDKPGHYTVFDNGKFRGFSRVVEYQLDEDKMTATKVWEYRHDPDRLSVRMGNAQRFTNGNTLINWSEENLPKATELNPSGEIVYEGNFESPSVGYRTLRYEKYGTLSKPYLMVEPMIDKTRLIFNKFGDLSVSGYNIYAAKFKEEGKVIASTQNTWFDVTNLENNETYVLYVTALDTLGNESLPSNIEMVHVRYPEPGENLVINGAFTDSTASWNLELDPEGIATGYVNNNEQFLFDIEYGGNDLEAVQVSQDEIPLIQGETYVFEFDARADKPRIIQAEIIENEEPFTNYSKNGNTYITSKLTRYSYEFVMEDPTDLNSVVIFNCGNNSIDVIIDNVDLHIKETATAIPNNTWVDKHNVNLSPNPVNDYLHIRYNIPAEGKIALSIYDINGRSVLRKPTTACPAGNGEVLLDVSGFEKGIYVCKIVYRARGKNKKQVIYKRMIR